MTSGATKSSFSSAAGLSMAESLPGINFEFDELRDRMAKFTIKFNNFIELGRKQVLEERNMFLTTVAELKEDQRMKKRDIEILVQKSSSHEQIVAKEETETKEMNSAVASLTAQRDAQLAAKEALEQQIIQTQKQIDLKLTTQRAHAQQLDSQARLNLPELHLWTSNLCMEIDGAGQKDRLKFTFTHVDDQDWSREACFELDISKNDYDIPYCKPKLKSEDLKKVIDKSNESRDLRVLLKGVRELFVEALKS
ncbi:putative kinetochore protein spc25 [Golovinomyces cichoracearum]|uniref:Kinetochore protein SPC25 n=1 Tax=Golovinomyces cichoracearum TaxID=62708 RepID=A0A420IUD6_9PEZI|nr:putative kinetochore protein spc25 [Golovinomyces cichoracearum]